ncbi:MAG: metallophosphoesterase, partial [Candidatus Electryoneaceae bacterium]|nr:metallophosphoesterase [Candidatus Electryoneaceae bacterium]
MKRIVWLTDIHLNFVRPGKFAGFTGAINCRYPDIVLISGDISEAPTISRDLKLLADYLQKPIYFVLGNHDYYRGSIPDVRKEVAELSEESEFLTWLPSAGIVEIGLSTALIGHGGWSDAREGDFFTSTVPLSDYLLINDFKGVPKPLLQRKLHKLGDEAADFVRDRLPKALDKYETVYFLTHSPP